MGFKSRIFFVVSDGKAIKKVVRGRQYLRENFTADYKCRGNKQSVYQLLCRLLKITKFEQIPVKNFFIYLR
jgi:hypothetical protein